MSFSKLDRPSQIQVVSDNGTTRSLGPYPSDMKRSEISPVFKKNDFMMKENYRPINIIGIFPKIFKSIIAKQIEKHMNNV